MKIESIKIQQIDDPHADLSYLGEFADHIPDNIEPYQIINHALEKPREFKYFIAANADNEIEAQSNYDRMQDYGKGWHSIGITAVAIVSYPVGIISRRLQQFESGGLWGIDSDSNESYLNEIIKEELADLKNHLTMFGLNIVGDLEVTDA